MADATALSLRNDGSVVMQADGSVALIDPEGTDCCCGDTCHCVESEGVVSPPSYRLQIGPLTVNALSCYPVYNPATDETEYFTVEGEFAGLDVCLFPDPVVPGQTSGSYSGSAPVGIVVKKWIGSCDGPPAETSSGCAFASIGFDSSTPPEFVLSIYLDQSPTPRDLPDGEWVIAATGRIGIHDLPAGWCADGFAKDGEAPIFDPDRPYVHGDEAWATLGGGTFTLTPCCPERSTCDCVECPDGLPTDYVVTGTRDGVAFTGTVTNDGSSCDYTGSASPVGASAFPGGATSFTLEVSRSTDGICGWYLFCGPASSFVFAPDGGPAGSYTDSTDGVHAYADMEVS